MKTITLYQPWATLVAIGAKKIETRSWPTKYRGPLAIHASLNKRFSDMKSKDYICSKYPFYAALTKGMINQCGGYRWIDFMPSGAIIATCNLDYCLQINPDLPSNLPPEPERSFGDYRTGRYMWYLRDIKRLEKPVYIKGQMGLWEWNP